MPISPEEKFARHVAAAKQHAHNAEITRAEKRGQPDLYGRR